MKWFLLALGASGVVIILAVAIGYALPVAHVATRRAVFNVPPQALFETITDVDAFPSWRREVKSVSRLPDRDGRLVWIEESRNGRMTLAVERLDPPRLLVLRIADPDLPFGGTWTYEVHPRPDGSSLTITENGEIYNPVFRFMARFVFGYEATMAAYLDALGRKFSPRS